MNNQFVVRKGNLMVSILLAVVLASGGIFYSPPAMAAEEEPAIVVILEGATDIRVEDSDGDVFTSGNTSLNGQVVILDEIGMEVTGIILQGDQSYKIKFTVASSPMTIEAFRGNFANEFPDYSISYFDLNTIENSKGLISVTDSKINRVKFDNNNDGSYETQPSPDYENTSISQSDDTQEPSISLDKQPSSNNLYINVGDESGVKSVYYSISNPHKYKTVDGTTLYTGPIDLSTVGYPQEIYVLAEDKAGNRGSWGSYYVSDPVPYPNGLPPGVAEGDLVRFANDPATIYTVSGNTFYAFENYQIYRYYQRINPHTVKDASGSVGEYSRSSSPASSVLGLPGEHTYTRCNTHPYPSGSLVNDKGTVFLIIGCLKIPFHNIQAFTGLGYSWTNVVSADLAQYDMRQTPGISSSEVPHTWGSWVSYNGTIYFSHPGGFIGAPSYELFVANGGKKELIVPANKYDIEEINHPGNSMMTLQNGNDAFVAYIDIFGPSDFISIPEPMPLPEPNLEGHAADAKRLSDVKQLGMALELYYNENNNFPSTLQGLVPSMLSVLPTAPTPPGSGCSDLENAYTYISGYQGRYELKFCLGSEVNGVSAGPHTYRESGAIF